MASDDSSKIEVHVNGIQNDILRYAYIAYLLFVMFSSLVGDSLVLVGTLKYQAMKINCFLVVLLQHIALVDILTCITYVLPQITYYMSSNRWVLGHLFCHANSIASLYLPSVNQLLISCMAFIKVLMIKFSSTSLVRNLTTKKGHILCSVIWMFSLIIPALSYTIENQAEVHLNNRNGLCELKLTSELWMVILPLSEIIFFVAPYIVVVVSTILLVQQLIVSRGLSRRIGSRQSWQGILVVSITATIFIVATLPYYIYLSVTANDEDMAGFFHNDFLRIAEACYSLNLACNFYIYSLTVPSFRKFVIRAVQTFMSFWQKSYASLRLSTTGKVLHLSA